MRKGHRCKLEQSETKKDLQAQPGTHRDKLKNAPVLVASGRVTRISYSRWDLHQQDKHTLGVEITEDAGEAGGEKKKQTQWLIQAEEVSQRTVACV